MRIRTGLAAFAGLTAGALTGAPAPAADAGIEADTLEEIVVTARRRDESFRDVPMTVNVFTAEAIEASGIRRPADFIAQVPNMQLVETQNAGNAFVVVRGISQARNSDLGGRFGRRRADVQPGGVQQRCSTSSRSRC